MPVSRQIATRIDDSPLAALTDSQLACLRLVPTGPSKVIAKQLGISHHTVDDHIREALRRLGASTRREAAAIVTEWEAAYPQELGTQPQTIANHPPAANIDASPDSPETSPPAQHNAVREERAEFSSSTLRSAGLARLTQLWFGSLFDDLTGPRRLRGTLILALIISVIVLVLVGVGNTVQLSVKTYFGL